MARIAELVGTISQPEVVLTFARDDRHPKTGEPMQSWVKGLPGRRWDPSRQAWVVQCFGTMPDRALREAGFTVRLDGPEVDASIAGLFGLDDLVPPLVLASKQRPIAVVRCRFSGWARTRDLLPVGAKWDKTTQRFEVRLVDLVKIENGERRIWPGLQYVGDSAEHAIRMSMVEAPTDSSIASAAASAAMSTGIDLTAATEEAVTKLVEQTGDIPEWFGLDLFPYQRLGAIAASAGRGLICDSPGLGKGSPVSEPILTPSGWSTYGAIRPGDFVVGSNGRPTRVKAIYDRGVLPTYRVDFGDADVVVDPEHLWSVVDERTGEQQVVDTATLMGLIERPGNTERYRIPMVEPVWFDDHDTDVDLDPFVEGERIAALAYRGDTTISDDILWHPDPGFRAEFLHSFLTCIESREFGEVRSSSDSILDGVSHLAWSLGGKAIELTPRKNQYGDRVPGVMLHLRGLVNCGAEPVRYIESITSYPNVERVVCLEVEADDALYVASGFIVTHNTRQALAAAALRNSQRTVIMVPPVVVTHWGFEADAANLASNCDGEIVMISAKKKEPDFPDRGVIVVPDSLMVSRPHLVQRIIGWAPEVFIYDEAHRARNWESKRSEMARNLTDAFPSSTLKICLTGTPLFAQPHELAPLLAMTGHLDPVFGGYSEFLSTYSRQNAFKAWVARKNMLGKLKRMLDEHVWVHRLKEHVLKDLPPKHRRAVFVDVDLKEYRKAHDDVIEKIAEWLVEFYSEKGRWPIEDEQEAWARQQIGVISPLRKAAGVAKVPYALDLINEWVAVNRLEKPAPDGSLYDRPYLIWAHHQEVVQALKDGIKAANKDVQVAVEIIDGATSAEKRGEIKDRFQEGKVGVLIASIAAAGVGITLTRGSDMLFVETDWTPALVSQAEDRQARFGQTQPVLCETLIAPDTLDQRIQKVLLTKAETLNEVLGGTEANVAVMSSDDELAAPAEIVVGLMPAAKRVAEKMLKVAA